jgi:two-component system, chemotaxis family, protein-glutamate methylesterase/glutaminase
MAIPEPPRRRDTIVIGCSAGGIEALPRILQQLPRDLRADVLIVQHMAASSPHYLVDILRRSAQIAVSWAEQGTRIEPGHVLVGPPDVHMLLQGGHVQLARTARENHSRPSIDKLFRSAAATRGNRVIGVLLTGMLDDGVAGLASIRQAGGLVIVQDPLDAAYPDLPARAIRAVPPDRTLPIDAIGGALLELAGSPVGPLTQAPDVIALEAEFDRAGTVPPDKMHGLGPQTTVSCPDCRGPMWLVGDEQTRRYRCYLGHATTARELLSSSSIQVEAALWSAVRALNDRAVTLEMLAADAHKLGSEQIAETYRKRASEARVQAEQARNFMVDLGRRSSS